MWQVEDTEWPEEGEKVQACIFKVGDDCRQDVLALQVVRCCLVLFVKGGPSVLCCSWHCTLQH